jgi:predicted alpha-1,2-mannosidase
MRLLKVIVSVAFCSVTVGGRAETSPVDLVNPLIGTAGDGQTFPGVGEPFAMTEWTPETRQGEAKCISPYYVADTRIYGFRGSHFLSGSCTQDYGSMSLMPGSGEVRERPSSAFLHQDEQRHPYLYSVLLQDDRIEVELTGRARSGFFRFRFERGGPSWIIVRSNSRPGEGFLKVDAEHNLLDGSNPAHRLYAGAGQPAGFSGYFVVRFDHAFRVADRAPTSTAPAQEVVLFDLKPGETVLAKVGTSFTSIVEAQKNLDAEVPDWNFNATVQHLRDVWTRALGAIRIDGNSPDRTIFYTALFHSMLLPRIFSDVSGTYPRFAGGQEIEKAVNYTYFCDFSLWDTFRALHPLLTIIQPEKDGEMVRSLVEKGSQGGFLPIYPAWNSYTSEMIGDHATAVIADAYAKGIGGFDIGQAYELMRKNAMETPSDPALYKDGRGRRALASYLKFGFIPLEDPVENAFHRNEQVSRTLEYAYDDFLVGEVAQRLGMQADADLFHHRAMNYRNVIDPAVGFARGRHADGTWATPFDPNGKYSYITEATPFQYTFFVPQDVPGLITLLGGRSAFITKLDLLFQGDHYDQGNEPSHQIAYLYDFAGAAWKTQEYVHRVMTTNYADRPDGLAGNDDAGQISAWYVMSALGFYQVTPGVPVYQIGTPHFDEATIALQGGKNFHIHARGAEAGAFYIHSATLNGRPLLQAYLTHAEIVAGGELTFEMSRTANQAWPSRWKRP